MQPVPVLWAICATLVTTLKVLLVIFVLWVIIRLIGFVDNVAQDLYTGDYLSKPVAGNAMG